MSENTERIGFITAVIPCRNEEVNIASCLRSVLENSRIGSGLEIIVADGMSTDGTRAIVGEMARLHPEIRLLDNPLKIQAAAMNIGIKAAKGEIIVRLDAHSEYGPGYVRDCVSLLLSTGAANAGGRVVTVPGGTGAWGPAFARVTSHPFGVGNAPFRTGRAASFVDTVPFGTFRKSLFSEIGYFDERLTRNEDNEFNERIIRRGLRIAFDPAIQIKYKNQSTLKGILRHTFFSSMWNIYAMRLHPYAWRPRRFIPLFFLLYMYSLPVSCWLLPAPQSAVSAIPLLAYLVLMLTASASAQRPVAENIRTFCTFFIYHLTYGHGMLWGTLNLLAGTWTRYLGKPVR